MTVVQPPLERVLLLGCGFLGLRVLRHARARGLACVATTRNPARAEELERLGAKVLVLPQLSESSLRSEVDERTGILVSFPPDGVSDAQCAPLATRAHSSVYISSTGVYGSLTGRIDDATPPHPDSPRARGRLSAEEPWRAAGASVLRAAAIYGPGSGMHTRLRAGSARIVGDGSGYVCRIHVDDLAAISLACMTQRVRGKSFVVADDEPAPQGDVVRYLAARLGLPVPPAVPIAEAPETLRHDRRVDASGIMRCLAMGLRYPTYREGFEACIAEEAAG
ncbi:MAG: SDR family NAD(P)-dependent oxidoreductase [Myxococcales bacterium]